MGNLFRKAPPKPLIAKPKGAKETYAVKYRGGRKVFDTAAEAMTFAEAERGNPEGWAEVSQCVEVVVSPR